MRSRSSGASFGAPRLVRVNERHGLIRIVERTNKCEFIHFDDRDYITVKLVALVAVPPDVTMTILPVFAPVGTVTVTSLSEFTVKLAASPPMVTREVCVRLIPIIVTRASIDPLVGPKLVI
jgi:hypothetical protein